MKTKEKNGIEIPEILLPGPAIDMTKWPVVACDQYTSQPEYWEEVAALVGDEPSTFHLIFPEVFLGDSDEAGRIVKIQQKMAEYLSREILIPSTPGFIFVNRRTARAQSRQGLMVAFDLECYDFRNGAKTLIRATEGTVLERIPPRVRVREGALLECPHVMALIDDPEGTVIEPLAREVVGHRPLYDTDLMMNGGHITGYQINDPAAIDRLQNALRRLADPEYFSAKYGVDDQNVLLCAVGDGNHSLATAKAVWEKLKQSLPSEARTSHPARYALVELVNVHDRGIRFEPIHRVVFNGTEDILGQMRQYFTARGSAVGVQEVPVTAGLEAMVQSRRKPGAGTHYFGFCNPAGQGIVEIKTPAHQLEVGTLQEFLDEWVKTNPDSRIDYIHGAEVVAELGTKPGNTGFFLPAVDKSDLFRTVIVDGVLPRKTFSMGEADEKRFYLECRKIIS